METLDNKHGLQILFNGYRALGKLETLPKDQHGLTCVTIKEVLDFAADLYIKYTEQVPTCETLQITQPIAIEQKKCSGCGELFPQELMHGHRCEVCNKEYCRQWREDKKKQVVQGKKYMDHEKGIWYVDDAGHIMHKMDDLIYDVTKQVRGNKHVSAQEALDKFASKQLTWAVYVGD